MERILEVCMLNMYFGGGGEGPNNSQNHHERSLRSTLYHGRVINIQGIYVGPSYR